MSKDVRVMLDRMLPVVAEEWGRLRRCDVYRLLDCFDLDMQAEAGRLIIEHRPEYADEVNESLADLEAEAHC